MREPQTLRARDPTLPTPVTTIFSETCYKELYKMHKKLVIHTSHLCFLNTCLRNNLIPRGLNIKTTPTIKEKDPGSPEHYAWVEWKHILRRTSTLLMQVLKRYHHMHCYYFIQRQYSTPGKYYQSKGGLPCN